MNMNKKNLIEPRECPRCGIEHETNRMRMKFIVCECGARLQLITEDITGDEQITYLQDENGFSFWDK